MEVRTDDALQANDALEANTQRHSNAELEVKVEKHASETHSPELLDFTLFQELPPELRLMVWEQAIAEELKSRRIILYKGRVIPLKENNSPLLSANQESRACARKVYDLGLTVYRIPWPDPTPRLNEQYVDYRQWRAKRGLFSGRDIDPNWDVYCAMFRWLIPGLIEMTERCEVKEGVIYISTAFDKRISTGGRTVWIEKLGKPWHILEPFWYEAANKIMKDFGKRVAPLRGLPWHHVTSQPPAYVLKELKVLDEDEV
ncbi:hypothetical protein F5Y18DRAFT_429732 [Xylariaceae sp. FL1019]|nr:hypothetical protein F5Y18DRAFT_429732 [Xylariaceae sp. FL1019]